MKNERESQTDPFLIQGLGNLGSPDGAPDPSISISGGNGRGEGGGFAGNGRGGNGNGGGGKGVPTIVGLFHRVTHPNFQSITVNIGLIGPSFTFSLTPTGQTFFTLGAQAGRAPELVSVSVTANYVALPTPTSQEVFLAVHGWATNVGGGVILGWQGSWNTLQLRPSTIGAGFFVPQAGVSFGYTFDTGIVPSLASGGP